jgi:excisionase family DNA binding protein
VHVSEASREPEDMLDRDEALLNSREVARLLDMSPDRVNEFARKRLLRAFKTGRQWRFRRQDIASFKRQLRGATAA